MTFNFHPELEELNREFQRRLSSAEGQLTPEEEKQILNQLVGEKFLAVPQNQATSAQQDSSASPPPQEPQDNAEIIQYQQLVNELIEITFAHGLEQGIKQARQTGNPYLIDQYHDELVNRFYQELKIQEK